MSFWPVFRRTRSLIDEILEKDEFTLEELLFQDDIVQECRYMNDGLLDYLSQPEIVERLIRYVIQSPPSGDGKEVDEGPNKYPFVASELFECGVAAMHNALFEKPELLGLLFSILERKPPLDPSSVAYFRKVASVLLQRKFEELTDWMREDEKGKKVLANMLNHIGLHSILEILNLLTWDDVERVHTSEEHMDWLCEERLIPRLVEKLDPVYESQAEVHANAGQALVDAALRAPFEHRGLQAAFSDKETLTKLFLFITSKSETSCQHGLSVLIALVQRHIKLYSGLDGEEEYHYDPGTKPGQETEDEKGDKKKKKNEKKAGKAGDPAAEKTPPGGKAKTPTPGRPPGSPPPLPFADLLIEHLPHLLGLLKLEPKATVMTLGKEIPVLGTTRLKIAELLLWVLRTSDSSLEKRFIETKVLEVLFDVFEIYEWHNMLHIRVANAVEAVLDGQATPLQKSLFTDAKILERLMVCYTRNDQLTQKPKGTRVGYMGHVIHMCNSIIDWHRELCNQIIVSESSIAQEASSSSSSSSTTTTTTSSTPLASTPAPAVFSPATLEAARELKEIVDKQLETKEWQNFVKEKLATDNEKMQVILGGHRPGDTQQQQQQPAPVPAPQEEFEVRQGGLEDVGFDSDFPFPQDDDDEDDELFNFDDPESDDKPTFSNPLPTNVPSAVYNTISPTVNQHQQTDLDSSSDSDDSDGDEYFSGTNHAQRGTKRVKDTSHHTTGIGAGDQSLASGSSSEHSSSSSTVTSMNHDSDDVDELGLPNIDSLSIDGGGTAGDTGGGT